MRRFRVGLFIAVSLLGGGFISASASDIDGLLYDAIPPAPAPPLRSSQSIRRVIPRPRIDDEETGKNLGLKVAWDEWHRLVSSQINQRFTNMASSFKYGKALMVRASYTIGRDHNIVDEHLIQASPNKLFNAMVLTVIHSLNGNELLAFPSQSSRKYVEKTAEFSINTAPRGDFGPHPLELPNSTQENLAK
jgi:hypothetical protein